ncbi:MAG: hypothetical protein WA020_12155 [Candidatus Acidiferrales bacterium]
MNRVDYSRDEANAPARLNVLAGVAGDSYAADWGVWQVRMAHQTALSTVRVDQFLATQWKIVAGGLDRRTL